MSKLKEVLAGRNWDVVKLSRKVAMMPVEIADYINGMTPALEKAKVIADELGFEVGELFPGIEDAPVTAEEAIEEAMVTEAPVEETVEETETVEEVPVEDSLVILPGKPLKCRVIQNKQGNEYPGYSMRRGEHVICKTGIMADEVSDGSIIISSPDLSLEYQISADTCPIVIDAELCVALVRRGFAAAGSTDRCQIESGDVVARLVSV